MSKSDLFDTPTLHPPRWNSSSWQTLDICSKLISVVQELRLQDVQDLRHPHHDGADDLGAANKLPRAVAIAQPPPPAPGPLHNGSLGYPQRYSQAPSRAANQFSATPQVPLHSGSQIPSHNSVGTPHALNHVHSQIFRGAPPQALPQVLTQPPIYSQGFNRNPAFNQVSSQNQAPPYIASRVPSHAFSGASPQTFNHNRQQGQVPLDNGNQFPSQASSGAPARTINETPLPTQAPSYAASQVSSQAINEAAEQTSNQVPRDAVDQRVQSPRACGVGPTASQDGVRELLQMHEDRSPETLWLAAPTHNGHPVWGAYHQRRVGGVDLMPGNKWCVCWVFDDDECLTMGLMGLHLSPEQRCSRQHSKDSYYYACHNCRRFSANMLVNCNDGRMMRHRVLRGTEGRRL
ncbi:hypothetical protein QBC42DRAFT_295271 [Cladorrhinum samala]|uniref:Uncharacterized protein n=1 Tax=Cladorrhinum samala TaxID=585594 RepID=A0AAV9HXQ7_9PEZI|nr:hypothetical protein QBC42DRAFT_295271 [Cladorrhinum samala]